MFNRKIVILLLPALRMCRTAIVLLDASQRPHLAHRGIAGRSLPIPMLSPSAAGATGTPSS